MAARSVIAKFTNNTKFVLTLDKSSVQLEIGQWVTSPPDQILPGDVGQWESESDSYDTGTQGNLRYQFFDQSTSNVYVNWMDPFSAESHYSIECDAGGFKVGHDGSNDRNATVDYYINEA
ncbi:Crystal protein ET79 [Burkholderia stabilis]|uniref:Crystal protein ET79 n=1 Tax=Burkholderia stabilis TaxID=95485 RepID=UPI001010F3D2|nr:Crystal protein ET79 [Burkholderia stabilis]